MPGISLSESSISLSAGWFSLSEVSTTQSVGVGICWTPNGGQHTNIEGEFDTARYSEMGADAIGNHRGFGVETSCLVMIATESFTRKC